MLQDLDALARRVQQAVQLAGTLQAERRALQARIAQLEQECEALKNRQQRERDEFTQMSQRLANHDQELQDMNAGFDKERAALEARAGDQQARAEALQRQLAELETDRRRLREAAAGARQQIGLILERLPGAEA